MIIDCHGHYTTAPHDRWREAQTQAFVGVGQLPQSAGVPVAHSIAELERCVNELGFPKIATTAELQRKLLVDNPMRLYWAD